MDNKLIINNDYIFSILANNTGEDTRTIVFGDSNNRLELTIGLTSDLIQSIDCIYVENILNELMTLDDYRTNNDIREYKEVSSYYEQHEVSEFIVNFNKDELDIILSKKLQPALYYADGRVEYYYDDNLDLIYVKVIKLTEDELEYFNNLSSNLTISK